jgi:hypothetical protein
LKVGWFDEGTEADVWVGVKKEKIRNTELYSQKRLSLSFHNIYEV